MDYRTIPQIAIEENVSRPTIYGWIKQGLLDSTKVGGQHRITSDQWENFLRRCNPRT